MKLFEQLLSLTIALAVGFALGGSFCESQWQKAMNVNIDKIEETVLTCEHNLPRTQTCTVKVVAYNPDTGTTFYVPIRED